MTRLAEVIGRHQQPAGTIVHRIPVEQLHALQSSWHEDQTFPNGTDGCGTKALIGEAIAARLASPRTTGRPSGASVGPGPLQHCSGDLDKGEQIFGRRSIVGSHRHPDHDGVHRWFDNTLKPNQNIH